jgi:hypothetical protein
MGLYIKNFLFFVIWGFSLFITFYSIGAGFLGLISAADALLFMCFGWLPFYLVNNLFFRGV